MSDEAERTDPILWKSITRAFHEAEYALWASVDAHCAHVVAHTLLADRKYRKEQQAKRDRPYQSDTFTDLMSAFANGIIAVHCAQEDGDMEPKEWELVKTAEQAISAFLESSYAEPSGLKE